ncbi:hypothetical protein IOQ59_10995 [Pontibacterium sp. N1Y112]|uniref:DUF4177 domain-containing protein n=1 Tax=Pontibacterium sinense TaxID=2781979 RepID=A0A8J7FK95_9GAMM|nr:hypothetical protein [Pontibacterium sinense]MBE9397783.1 hypothetical protein [Pontibacterium sinense]
MKTLKILLLLSLMPVVALADQFAYEILEYNKFHDSREIKGQLNKMGQVGWELISVDKHIATGAATFYRYTLKRKVIRREGS